MFLKIRNRGLFYEVFDEDALILHYLFGYKIGKGNRVGFPIKSKNKVVNKLIDKKINYRVIDEEGIEEKDFKTSNGYNKILDRATRIINREERVISLQKKVESLDNNSMEELLDMIEDFVNAKEEKRV